MDQTALRPPSLFGLLAREWQAGAAIARGVFNNDQTAVAFADVDGGVTIAALADGEPASARVHVDIGTGVSTIRARKKSVPPPVSVKPLSSEALWLAPFGRAAFAACSAEGRLFQLTARGQAMPVDVALSTEITGLTASSAHRTVALAAGGEAVIAQAGERHASRRLPHDPPITTLAFSPDGKTLAAAHAAGILLAAAPELTSWRDHLPLDLVAESLAWSRDSRWLACRSADGDVRLLRLADASWHQLPGLRRPLGAWDWSGPSNALVAGGFRVRSWAMIEEGSAAGLSPPLESGKASVVRVTALAAHPGRDLVAVGYADGRAGLAQIGREDELLLRMAGDGQVTLLAWSDDGSRLALATSTGMAALIDMPPQLFK